MLLFVIAVALSSLEMLNAQDSKREKQPSNFQDDQFLFSGDVFHATFLQPTLAHIGWSRQQWSEEFHRLRQLEPDH